METKNGDTFCERVWYQIGMGKVFYVSLRGSLGGLALWWREEIFIHILSANPYIIDTMVTFILTGITMHMIWIHADTDENQRNQNWEELRLIARGRKGMWITMGDFNAITHHHEK